MSIILRFFAIAVALSAQACLAAEVLISTAHYASGEEIPYILNFTHKAPRYVVILFPGGTGLVNPRYEDGKLVYGYKGNFLVRSRKHIVDEEFVTVTTNSTESEERIQGLLDDLKTRFPGAQIYLMGTSRGTYSTMALADYLSDRIAGVIHTSSLNQIYFFNGRKYKNRHLIVHHKNDYCHATLFQSAQRAHEKYGTDFIAMEGGIATGEPCEAFSYHGYNGIENETIQAIKRWIRQGNEN